MKQCIGCMNNMKKKTLNSCHPSVRVFALMSSEPLHSTENKSVTRKHQTTWLWYVVSDPVPDECELNHVVLMYLYEVVIS